jgi:uncharacterized RDD family membrane protein YckC
MTAQIESPADRDLGLQGHYAGIVTRLAAFAIDALVATTLFAIAGRVIEFVWSSLLGGQKLLSDARIASAVILAIWLLVYFAYPLAVSGRTLGMAVVGLQVVTKAGGDIGGKHAVIRTLVLPLSVAFALIGVLIMLINRDRRALHDLIAGTSVVYSWNARAARMRFLAKPDT